MLPQQGYDVSTTVDAESGLQAALSATFDAVLLDLVMPMVEGLAWLRRFRASPPHPTTPVAIVTGNSLIEDKTARDLEELGAIVQFKPLWVEDLLALTKTLIEGNR